MSEAPSWLKPGNEAPAAAPSSLEVSAPAAAASGLDTTAAVVSAEDDKDLPSIILMMRLTNMGLAVALIAISVSSTK